MSREGVFRDVALDTLFSAGGNLPRCILPSIWYLNRQYLRVTDLATVFIHRGQLHYFSNFFWILFLSGPHIFMSSGARFLIFYSLYFIAPHRVHDKPSKPQNGFRVGRHRSHQMQFCGDWKQTFCEGRVNTAKARVTNIYHN